MNPIQSWSPRDLNRVREAITGEAPRPSRADQEVTRSGMQDVLILTPSPLQIERGLEARSSEAASPEQLQEKLSQAGVAVKESFEDIGVSAQVTSEQASDLQEQGFILLDDSPRQMQPSLPHVATQGKWALPDIDGGKMVKGDVLNQAGATGKGQVVVVLDSGFDYAPMNDKVPYLNIITGSDKHHDGSGHGTHVASDILKTAPDASLMAIQVMNDDGTGRLTDIIKGLKAVEKLKDSGTDVDVVNMSLGGPPDGLPDTLNPINRMVDRLSKKGITVVVAAGNSGPDAHTIGAPGDAPTAIAVGAALDPKTVSDFSSHGPTDDGDVRPHIMAPGEFIPGWGVAYSDMYKNAQAVDGLRAKNGDELKDFLRERPKLIEALGLPEDILSRPPEEVEEEVKPKLPPIGINERGEVMAPGTSFASPITAGVVASLEQIKDLSPEENRELLMRNADSMGNYDGNTQGAGFINAEKLLSDIQKP